MVLVDAGRLGLALLQYDEFERYSVKISAAFDSNERAISFGLKLEILPMRQFEYFCKTQNIKLGIITVGQGSAQAVCDKMIKSGITVIWNFAPCKLKVPVGVLLQNKT